MTRRPISPADDPQLMEKVLRYVQACDRRNWYPVFTLEQFRAIYKAVMREPLAYPHTDSFPPDFDRVTLFGVPITVSDNVRPPMPESMLERDSPLEETPVQVRERIAYVRAMARARRTEPGRQEWDGYEPHDLPPRSM